MKLTDTEAMILQEALDAIPADRFADWTDEDGNPIDEEYLDNLYNKLETN